MTAHRTLLRAFLMCAALLLPAAVPHGQPGARDLYREHCAACHGLERLGGMGPALLPENLERLRKPAAEQVIAQGRIATQMPGFADKLDAPYGLAFANNKIYVANQGELVSFDYQEGQTKAAGAPAASAPASDRKKVNRALKVAL